MIQSVMIHFFELNAWFLVKIIDFTCIYISVRCTFKIYCDIISTKIEVRCTF
jgi:hypothetical protein